MLLSEIKVSVNIPLEREKRRVRIKKKIWDTKE